METKVAPNTSTPVLPLLTLASPPCLRKKKPPHSPLVGVLDLVDSTHYQGLAGALVLDAIVLVCHLRLRRIDEGKITTASTVLDEAR